MFNKNTLYAIVVSIILATLVILGKKYIGVETTLMIYHYASCFFIGAYFGTRD